MEHTSEWENNVELSGFGDMGANERAVVDKIVANHTRRIASQCEHFEKLRLTMKGVHAGDGRPKKVELHAKLVDNGRTHTSEVVDHDIYVVLDRALEKLEHSVAR